LVKRVSLVRLDHKDNEDNLEKLVCKDQRDQLDQLDPLDYQGLRALEEKTGTEVMLVQQDLKVQEAKQDK
jgi:enolase